MNIKWTDWLQETLIETVGVGISAYIIGYLGGAIGQSWLTNPILPLSIPVAVGLFVTMGLANFLQATLKIK